MTIAQAAACLGISAARALEMAQSMGVEVHKKGNPECVTRVVYEGMKAKVIGSRR